jgi:Right handed beta helix region
MSIKHAAALAAAVGALCALAAAPAHAVELNCGDVITQDTRLTADVGPCASGPGVVIGAPNVELDLHGHRVIGAAGNNDTGINALQLNTTVTRGAVEGFLFGVEPGDGSEVSRMRFTGTNGTAIFGLDADDLVITRNRISQTFAGIGTDFGGDNVITRNRVTGPCAIGIAAGNSDGGNLWARNIVTGCAQIGFLFDLLSPGDVAARNRALRNGGDGFRVNGPVRLVENRAEGNDDEGIDAAGVIDGGRNRARRNGGQQCVGLTRRR